MIKAETHLGTIKAETHLGMIKTMTTWLRDTSAPAASTSAFPFFQPPPAPSSLYSRPTPVASPYQGRV